MPSKWFSRNSVPTKDGIKALTPMKKFEYKKCYELELSNMEGAPVYSLTNQLSVGSEIGNIVVSDPSVSPRHASFILQQEVVSVLDHGSVSGTFVNGQKIPPGKYIILEEADVVLVGELEIRLKVGMSQQLTEEIPEVPELEEVPERNVKPLFKKPIIKATSKPVLKVDPDTSANAIVRLFAVIGDLLLSYTILIIFRPFDEFRDFLNFVPSTIDSLIGIDWHTLWTSLAGDYGFAVKMVEDTYEFLSNTFHFGPLLTVFFTLRALTSLCMRVSFSEYMLGVRGFGDGTWARMGGCLRVLVGIITGPFLIFDLPAIVSKRTFKEMVTFTRIFVPSKFVTILGVILFLPLMVGLALVSPLLQGFEPPEAILVNDKIDQRVKVKMTEAGTAAATVVEVTDSSKILNTSLTYNSNELFIIPSFKFRGIGTKLTLKNSLVFYERELQRHVEVEVFKNFDLKELLGIGIRGNIFLYEKYPKIYNYVYEAKDVNPMFKKTVGASDQAAFANEFIQFTKTALSLDATNAFDIMQSDTLLIKGLIEYKASFLSLLEYKDFDQVGFIKLGNALFMKVSFHKQKPFDLIIPLVKGQGQILKVTFDKKENLGALTSKFYKFALDKTDWGKNSNQVATDVLSPLGVFDLFSGPELKTFLSSSDRALSLYGYYFEASGAVMRRSDSVELELWINNLKDLVKLVEALPANTVAAEQEDPKVKVLQNLKDLLDALESRNLQYFQINQVGAI